jgi:chloramphenicol-sensitive protein RarD
MKKDNEQSIGIGYASLAYLLWGFLPLYWKPLQAVPSGEILAHRIIWSFVFMLIILLSLKRVPTFVTGLKDLFLTRRNLISVLSSSVLISANWLFFIYAVNSNNVVEASLGYYINPLVSVLLGIMFFKEKLNFWQIISFVLALIGVSILTVEYGKVPWIAFILALSFGLYGLTKKLGKYDSIMGLTFETMFVTPIAFIYVLFIHQNGTSSFGSGSLNMTLLLLGAGIVTAIPLLCFAQGAKKIPLSMIGFLQYIAPTLMLLLGIFVFEEVFSIVHMISFLLIWCALISFTFSRTKWMVYLQPKLGKRKSFDA